NPRKPIDMIEGKIAIVITTPTLKFSDTLLINDLDCFTANFASNQDSFNNGMFLRLSCGYGWSLYVVCFSNLIGASGTVIALCLTVTESVNKKYNFQC